MSFDMKMEFRCTVAQANEMERICEQQERLALEVCNDLRPNGKPGQEASFTLMPAFEVDPIGVLEFFQVCTTLAKVCR